MNLERHCRIDVTLRDGTRQSVMGTRVIDEDQHCLVVIENGAVVAWFDWANIREWSQSSLEEKWLTVSA